MVGACVIHLLITSEPSIQSLTPSSPATLNRYTPVVGKSALRVHRAEKLSTPRLQAPPGPPSPKLKLRNWSPSSRTISGSPLSVVLLKYIPFQWFEGTSA